MKFNLYVAIIPTVNEAPHHSGNGEANREEGLHHRHAESRQPPTIGKYPSTPHESVRQQPRVYLAFTLSVDGITTTTLVAAAMPCPSDRDDVVQSGDTKTTKEEVPHLLGVLLRRV